MKSMSVFQIVVLVIFSLGLVLAVLVFSGFLPGFKSSGSAGAVRVTLWGSIPAQNMTNIVSSFNGTYQGKFILDYHEVPSADFETTFVDALARGQGPDLIILPQDLIVSQADKLYPISYSTVSLRTFKETFIDAGNIYLADKGIMALPIGVDPLVMYYNPTLFANAGIVEFPRTWTQMLVVQPKLTTVDQLTSSISTTALALGETTNITNAKSILLALMQQASGSLVERRGGSYVVAFSPQGSTDAANPNVLALNFFTQFSDPTKSTYSWNRAMDQDLNLFLNGTLATYFGFASELGSLQAKNPNLKLEVLPFPQPDQISLKSTYAKITGLAVVNATPDKASAVAVATALASKDFSGKLADTLAIVPARRDLFVREVTAANAFKSVFFDSAVISRGFLDPNSVATKSIFDTMIFDIDTRRASASQALTNVQEQINNLFFGLKK